MKNTKFPQLFFFKQGKKLPPPPKTKNHCVENIHKYTRYVEQACAYGRKKPYTINEIVIMRTLNCFEALISINGHLSVIITNVVYCIDILGASQAYNIGMSINIEKCMNHV